MISKSYEKLSFLFEKNLYSEKINKLHSKFINSEHFNHIVIDNFLTKDHADFLYNNFPNSEHQVWLDWKIRSKSQYGVQGIGNTDNLNLIDPFFKLALMEFNNSYFLTFLEKLTGIEKVLPDPYFSGGGIHQTVEGGILDIHTDFNDYKRLDLYRQINVLLYLNKDYKKEFGGELELWDKSPKNHGSCFKKIEPIFNRCVIFKTDKTSFHGQPNEWKGPGVHTRKSIATYYYTSKPFSNFKYDHLTDFQGVVSKELPSVKADEIKVKREEQMTEKDALMTEKNKLIAEKDALMAEKNNLLNSTSWKITSPLRKLKKIIKNKQ
jgi:Rps23 Pro-64 3,4-dihydroxylase Tpa1-like proline 4-hydroxylase